MPRSFVEQACARCSVPGSRLWFNCNPEGPQHWFYRSGSSGRGARALYLHFTMEDNPGLTPRVRARYSRMYSGVFYRRFMLGEWVAAEGRVYDFFDETCCAPPPEDVRNSPCPATTAPRIPFPGAVGAAGRRLVQAAGVLLRLPAGGTAENRRGIRGELGKLAGDGAGASWWTRRRPASSRRCGGRAARREGRQRRGSSGIRVTADMLKNGRLVICAGCGDACGSSASTAGRKRRRDAP
jgi:hypothetical protein